MKPSTFAGLLLLLFAGGFVGVIYLVAHTTFGRYELIAFVLMLVIAALLIEPDDMKQVLGKVLDRIPFLKDGGSGGNAP